VVLYVNSYWANGPSKKLTNKYGAVNREVFNYTYDANKNMLTKVDSKGTTSYIYDEMNRLTKVTEPSGRVTAYTFDASGNRSREKVTFGVNSSDTSYTYDTQNRLTRTEQTLNTSHTETSRYYYDYNGNLIARIGSALKDLTEGNVESICLAELADESSGGSAVNTYDNRNQLVSVNNGAAVSMSYNGEGLRVAKTVTGSTDNGHTQYVYERDKVVLELNAGVNQEAYSVYSGDTLLCRTVGSQTVYYSYNGHGDVTALTDGNGTLLSTYYYDAFGNIIEKTGTTDNNITYAGYQFDFETGLYYVSSRYYEPVFARFMSNQKCLWLSMVISSYLWRFEVSSKGTYCNL
jgi:RHS repeat-associated protein